MITHKTILIISPQEWNSIKVSKHHYAEELANLNNKVYFINPIKSGIKFFSITQHNKIKIVNIFVPLPYSFKFKIPFLFEFFQNLIVQILLKLHHLKTDIVWDFDNTHQFKSYKIFKSKINIYHPVDATYQNNLNIKNKKPDIVFSVSPLILNKQQFNCPKFFVNHGLSHKFIIQAKKNLFNYYPINKIKNVGYSGNLDSKLINITLFEKAIKNYKQINFWFIGPFTKNCKLVNHLNNFSNCYFTGSLDEDNLIKKLNEMDMLIYYYKSDNDTYLSDNSHKVLEYLSTGKIILGNQLLAYQNNNLLIQASNNIEWLNLFNEIVNNTSKFIDEAKYKERIEFAISHSYKNQLNKISNYLIQNKLL